MLAIFNSLVCSSVHGFSSVAVPTISDEYDKVPTRVAAKCFFNALDKYAAHEQDRKTCVLKISPVTDIRFTNFNEDTVASFVNEFDERCL